jgi:ribokinase
MNHSHILTLGSAYMDTHVPGFPFTEQGLLPETETIGGDYGITPGGSAVNFARNCIKLGLKATFVGKVGNDLYGKLLAQKLQAEHVTPELITDDEVSTNIGINLINEDGLTIMAVAGTANQALGPNDVAEKIEPLLPEIDYLYFGGCFKLKRLFPVLKQLAQDAQASGTKVVIDHGRVPENVTAEDKAIVRSLVSLADYYFPSEGEFLNLWHATSIEAGLHAVTLKAGGHIAIKCSNKGAYSIADDQILHVPAFRVTPRHTAGAGDSFNAGFITATAGGLSLQQSLEFGCAVAALKISRDSLPTRADVETFLAQRPDVFTQADIV